MTIWRAIIAAWSSRKLWAFLLTVSVLWLGWERVIWHLYALPVDKCGVLLTISNVVFGIVGCAAGAYMGFNSWQARFAADSVASVLSETKSVTVSKFEKLTRDFAEKYRDDPSYRPIMEGEG